MKTFLRKNWTLILVMLYGILPDFIPGPVDDSTLLIAELARKLIAGKISNSKKDTPTTS